MPDTMTYVGLLAQPLSNSSPKAALQSQQQWGMCLGLMMHDSAAE